MPGAHVAGDVARPQPERLDDPVGLLPGLPLGVLELAQVAGEVLGVPVLVVRSVRMALFVTVVVVRARVRACLSPLSHLRRVEKLSHDHRRIGGLEPGPDGGQAVRPLPRRPPAAFATSTPPSPTSGQPQQGRLPQRAEPHRRAVLPLRRRLEDRAEGREIGAGRPAPAPRRRRSGRRPPTSRPSPTSRRASPGGIPAAGRWTPSAPAATATSNRSFTRSSWPASETTARSARAMSSSSRPVAPRARSWTATAPGGRSPQGRRRVRHEPTSPGGVGDEVDTRGARGHHSAAFAPSMPERSPP